MGVEGCRGSDGSPTPTREGRGRQGEDERVGGEGLETGGTFREKWLYEVGKTFGTKRKEKVATVGTLNPLLPPQCHGYRVIYRQIVDGGSVSSNRNYRFGHSVRNYGADRFLFLAFTWFKRCFDEGRNSPPWKEISTNEEGIFRRRCFRKGKRCIINFYLTNFLRVDLSIQDMFYIMDNYNDTIEQILKIDIKIDINEKHIVTLYEAKNKKSKIFFWKENIESNILYMWHRNTKFDEYNFINLAW